MIKFELNLRERNISEEKLLEDLKRVALLSQGDITSVLYSQKGLFLLKCSLTNIKYQFIFLI